MLSGDKARNAFRAYLEEKLKPILERLKVANKQAAGFDIEKEYHKDQLVAEISRLQKRLDDLRAENKKLQNDLNAQKGRVGRLEEQMQIHGLGYIIPRV